jgi:hypothetical protein
LILQNLIVKSLSISNLQYIERKSLGDLHQLFKALSASL